MKRLSVAIFLALPAVLIGEELGPFEGKWISPPVDEFFEKAMSELIADIRKGELELDVEMSEEELEELKSMPDENIRKKISSTSTLFQQVGEIRFGFEFLSGGQMTTFLVHEGEEEAVTEPVKFHRDQNELIVRTEEDQVSLFILVEGKLKTANQEIGKYPKYIWLERAEKEVTDVNKATKPTHSPADPDDED